MTFSLDTNVCISIINRSSALVRERLHAHLAAGDDAVVSSIAVFELSFGVANSHINKRIQNHRNLKEFLSGPFKVLDFDLADSIKTGEVRAELRLIGKPIGQYDLLIAGQAMRRGLTLVTANVAEFSRVTLNLVDWSSPASVR